jgi:PAS domain S-box-containing protein
MKSFLTKLMKNNAMPGNIDFSLLDNIPNAIAIVNLQGEIIYFNQCFESLFGYSFSEIKHFTQWFDFVYPDVETRKRNIENWKNDLQKKKENPGYNPVHIYNITCSDASVKHIEINFKIDNNLVFIYFTNLTPIFTTITEFETRTYSFIL